MIKYVVLSAFILPIFVKVCEFFLSHSINYLEKPEKKICINLEIKLVLSKNNNNKTLSLSPYLTEGEHTECPSHSELCPCANLRDRKKKYIYIPVPCVNLCD